MKVQFILLLLSVSCLALAVPALSNDSINDSSREMHNGDHSLTMRSPNEAHAVSIHLENRALTCGERNGKFIRVIKDTTAQLAFLNIGAHFASEICEHYHFDDCSFWIKIIQWAINSIFAVASARGAVDGADGVSPDQELQSIDARGASATGYADSIKQWLHDERFNYENVEEVDVLTLAHQTRNLDEPDLRHRAIIRAIKSEGGFTHEVAFNHYGNGGTVLHLSGPNQTFAVDPSSKIKRSGFGHEGFKISFTTRKGARLTTAEQNDMAHAIAFDWSQQVFNTEDYIGLVKDGHTADFYFRIIPEVKGFGLNYESVDVSGGMAGLL